MGLLKVSKGIPRQAEVALGVPGRLRPRITTTFGTTRVVGRQPNTPAALTPGEIPGTHFQRLSRPQGTWFCQKEPRKKSPVTPPGTEPWTVRLVALASTLTQALTWAYYWRIIQPASPKVINELFHVGLFVFGLLIHELSRSYTTTHHCR